MIEHDPVKDRFIIFSDQHKGARNGADDFMACEGTYAAALDYYNRQTRDILYTNFPLPPSLGVTNLAAKNSASMENKGLEIAINYRNKSKMRLRF